MTVIENIKETFSRILSYYSVDLKIPNATVNVNGKSYSVCLFGNDEMFDGDDFYQLGYDPENNKLYKFYYEIDDEDIDTIDYKNAAYKAEDITRDYND